MRRILKLANYQQQLKEAKFAFAAKMSLAMKFVLKNQSIFSLERKNELCFFDFVLFKFVANQNTSFPNSKFKI